VTGYHEVIHPIWPVTVLVFVIMGIGVLGSHCGMARRRGGQARNRLHRFEEGGTWYEAAKANEFVLNQARGARTFLL
jgi:hypothetical protein